MDNMRGNFLRKPFRKDITDCLCLLYWILCVFPLPEFQPHRRDAAHECHALVALLVPFCKKAYIPKSNSNPIVGLVPSDDMTSTIAKSLKVLYLIKLKNSRYNALDFS